MTGKQPFEAVVAAHGGTVLRVCRAVLGAADADDAWSETFLAAMRAYPGLPADANVEAWLVTIAHRKAIDVTRAAARRRGTGRRSPGERGRRGRQPARPGRRSGRCPDPAARPAEASRGLPLPGRAALQRRCRHPGRQPRGRPARRGRRHRQTPARHRRRTDEERPMNIDDLTPDLVRAFPANPARAEPAGGAAGRRGPARRDPGCGLPDDRQPGRHAAAGRDRPGPDPRGLRQRGSRRGSADPGQPGQPAGPARPGPAGCGRPGAQRVLRRAPPPLRPPAGPAARGRVPAYRAEPPARDRLRAHRDLRRRRAAGGQPRAFRAVGTACATNPLPVVVPCHRVVRSDGSTGGYLGGPAAKRTLLALEAA